MNGRLASNITEFIMRDNWARLNRKKIADYLSDSDDPEIRSIGEYLKSNNINTFPYSFATRYNGKDYKCIKDSSAGLRYYELDGKRMYLKKKYNFSYLASRYIKNLNVEQDHASPHRYMTDTFYPHEGDVLIDVGGAEGIFTLSNIERIKHAYIFECDPEWIHAMEKTFEPYKDKITIIAKFASDHSDSTHMSIDDLIKEYSLQNENLFIKIDAEGDELRILDGATMLNEAQNCSIAVCTYHRQEHEDLISKRYKDWNIEHSSGYMIYYYDYDISEPYVRRGLLRITSNKTK